jgi:hypothetical protein
MQKVYRRFAGLACGLPMVQQYMMVKEVMVLWCWMEAVEQKAGAL